MCTTNNPTYFDLLEAYSRFYLERAAGQPNYVVRINHARASMHVLDDLEGGTNTGGFVDGFHKGIEPLI